jgi:hypothetical protein
MPAAATSRQPYHVGRQNLPAFAHRAQPGSFYHRITEIVTRLVGDFPPTESNPESNRPIERTIVLCDPLLHGRGTGESIGSSSKRNHETIAQVLYLDPICFDDRLAKNGEVPSSQLIRFLGIQTRRELG